MFRLSHTPYLFMSVDNRIIQPSYSILNFILILLNYSLLYWIIVFQYCLNKYMFKQASPEEQIYAVQQWYRYQLEQVELKFKDLHTDALEEIKNKIRRKQTLQQKDENIEILQRQRNKILQQMRLHVKQCQHPHCQSVDEITLMYNLRHLESIKKDPVHLINKYGECSGYVQTDCPVGSQINKRMLQTHHLLKNQVM